MLISKAKLGFFYLLLQLAHIVALKTTLQHEAVRPYDYSATVKCLAEPLEAQYGGGILVNSEFNEDLSGWSRFGWANIERRTSYQGNGFVVAHNRKRPYDSVNQRIQLKKNIIYTFSAWVQISKGRGPVKAIIKTGDGTYTHTAVTVARSGCWSMMKGGLSPQVSGLATLYFESNNTDTEIWVDSVSLQPFTQQEWRSHQVQSAKSARKRTVRIRARDGEGKVLPYAKVSIKLTKPSFPFGCAINKNILDNPAYQSWFLPRFSVSSFEDEMKWYSTEAVQGKEDYSVPDALMALAKNNGISVRGHNVLWDDPKFQPGWVTSLSPSQLTDAATKRVNSIMNKYKGQMIGWDVVNENLHFDFFEGKLGANASTTFYQLAHQIDPGTTMFLNEFNTIEESGDGQSSPANYISKLNQVKASGPTGIGLEGHFTTLNLAYMRSAIDTLGATGAPVWITEVDVASGPNQADLLEQILTEAHAHPSVKGIVVWAAWKPGGCYKMCLTDNSFKNLATGDVVDKMIKAWGGSSKFVIGETDGNGVYEGEMVHGDYEITVTNSNTNSSLTRSLTVDHGATTDALFQV